MSKPEAKSREAYLYEMLEAATLVRRYMEGVSYEQFCIMSEKQDAVSLRLSVLGEAASKAGPELEKSLPKVPFRKLNDMRNRIAHDYGSIDFEIVWEVVRKEIEPLIESLESFLRKV